MKKIFMFSGQGSQYYGMGLELYRTHHRFRLWMDHCDELASYELGCSFIEVLYDENLKMEAFDDLCLSSLAILAIEFSLAKILIEQGVQPDAVLGYSMGEVCALVIAGVLTLEEAISYIISYSKAIEKTLPAGFMLAVVEREEVLQKLLGEFPEVSIAARNFDKHCVVSGHKEILNQLQTSLNKKNIVTQALPVNFAFHSKIMAPAEAQILRILDKLNFKSLQIPYYSATLAGQVESIDRLHLWSVTYQTVEFNRAFTAISRPSDFLFIDVGPSGTLATFVRYLVDTQTGKHLLSCMNQYGRNLETLDSVLSACQPNIKTVGTV